MKIFFLQNITLSVVIILIISTTILLVTQSSPVKGTPLAKKPNQLMGVTGSTGTRGNTGVTGLNNYDDRTLPANESKYDVLSNNR